MTELLFMVVAGVIALTLQTTSFGFMIRAAYKPELMMILVVWASLRTSFVPGMGFAFAGGIVVDTLSGSPSGLFAVIYSIVFVACGYSNATFDIDSQPGRAVTIFVSTLACGFLVMLIRWLEGPAELGWLGVELILLKSLVTGAAALAMIPLLDRLWAGFSRLAGVR